MNNTIKQLCAEFEKMEKTIAFQQQIISTSQKPIPACPYACPQVLSDYPKLKLDDCSWDEIAMYGKSGMASHVFSVGDTKVVPLTDNTSIHVRIIGLAHDKDRENNILPITFETVETLNRDFRMNEESTNKGGWQNSAMRRVLNDTVFNDLLPDDLKAVISPCLKETSLGGNSEKTGFTSDNLFILSEQEIFGRKIYSHGNEGHWYDWYKQENVSYAKAKQNGEQNWRWERSRSGAASAFCAVGSSGSASNYTASAGHGVSFGFCV